MPKNWQAAPAQPRGFRAAPQVNAALAGGAAPRPTIRLQSPDTPETPRTPLTLPAPESLGIGIAKAPGTEVDWNDVRQRLQKLGAIGFHLDQVAGHWRATVLVPGSGLTTRHVEASAAGDAAAVASALQQAESIEQNR